MRSRLSYSLTVFVMTAAVCLRPATGAGQESEGQTVATDSLSTDVLEAAFLLILDEDERQAYNVVSELDEKLAWQARYWRQNDPTPTTVRNERLEEHYRRIRYSRRWFAGRSHPILGVDDRGLTYIRYGEPDARYQQAGTGPLRSNESWAYNIGSGLLFEFVETGSDYQFNDLTKAIIGVTGQRAQYLSLLLELYQGRIDIHPRYSEIYQKLQMAEQDAIAFGSAASALQDTSGDVAGYLYQGASNDVYTNDIQSVLENARERIYRERSEAPKTRYVYEYHAKPLPIVFSFANFRARGSAAKVELLYAVDFGNLGVRRDSEAGALVHLDQSLIVFDAEMMPVGGDSGVVDIAPRRDATVQNQYYVNNATLRLKPGGYQLALQVNERDRKRLGIYRTAFTAREFATDRLDLSDVVFSHYIRDSVGDRLLDIGRDIAPYPFSKVERSQPIYVYFEIYNLSQDAFGQTSYRIAYTVRRTRGASLLSKVLGGGDETEVSATLERFGSSPDAGEYLQLDLGRLPTGNSLLSLQVEDLNAKAHAETKRRFELVP